MDKLLTPREIKLFTERLLVQNVKLCPMAQISACTARLVERHVHATKGKLDIPYIELEVKNKYGRCRFQYPVNELHEDTFGTGSAMRAGYPEPETLKAFEARAMRCRECIEKTSRAEKKRLRRIRLMPSYSSSEQYN